MSDIHHAEVQRAREELKKVENLRIKSREMVSCDCIRFHYENTYIKKDYYYTLNYLHINPEFENIGILKNIFNPGC